MSFGRLSSLVLSLAIVSLVRGSKIQCSRPFSPEQCAAIMLMCPKATAENCKEIDYIFLQGGGTCGFCDICAKFVDHSERCNDTSKLTTNSGESVDITTICKAPLVCSTQRTCVREEECSYDD